MDGSSSYRVTKGRQSDRTTVQSTATSHKIMRRAGGGQDFSATYEPDGEVREDLFESDQIPLDLSAGHTFEGFDSYNTYDEEFEDVLWSTYNATSNTTISEADCTMAAADNSIATAAGDFSGVTAYEIISVTGGTQFATTTFVRATSAVTLKIVVDSDWAAVTNEGSADISLTIKHAQYLRPGTTMHYNTIEEKFASDDWQIWVAAIGQSASWTRENKAKAAVNFGYVVPAGISSSGLPGAATILTGGSPTAATTSRIVSHKHLTVFREGVAATTLRTKGNSFQCQRSSEDVGTHGVLGAEDFVKATLAITGQLEIVNEAAAQALINKMRNDTVTGHAFKIADLAGNVTWYDIPSIFYTGATRSAGGKDTKVTLPLPFSARMHPTFLFPIQICKFDA